MKALSLAISLAIAAMGAVAHAHPHARSDQQLVVSIGIKNAELRVLVAPSAAEGAAAFRRFDQNSDGIVTNQEGAHLASRLFSQATFEIDGRTVEIEPIEAKIPPSEILLEEGGVIEMKARAAYRLDLQSAHTISIAIDFREIAADWFIQPYFYPELLEGTSHQQVDRKPNTSRITVNLGARK